MTPSLPSRRDRSLERWIAASAVGHAALFAFAVFAPPPTVGLVLERDAAPVLFLAPVELAPPAVPSPPREAAERSGAGSATHEAPGRARARRRSREVARAVDGDDPRDVLAAIEDGLASVHPTESPYSLARATAPSLAMLGPLADGDGLDMNGTGRGAGGVPVISHGWGGRGFGSTCGDGEVAVAHVRRGGTRDVGCVAGTLGFGVGMGALATRGNAEARHEGTSRCGEPPCPVPPAIHLASADATGSLSREVVRRVVARGRSAIRHCYEQALIARPDLRGRVSVQWIVSPDGRVSASAIDTTRSDLRAPAVESCILSTVSRWSFPQAAGPTAVTYPFVLDVAP